MKHGTRFRLTLDNAPDPIPPNGGWARILYANGADSVPVSPQNTQGVTVEIFALGNGPTPVAGDTFSYRYDQNSAGVNRQIVAITPL